VCSRLEASSETLHQTGAVNLAPHSVNCYERVPEQRQSESVLVKSEQHGGEAKQGASSSHGTRGCHAWAFVNNPAIQ
jgi:hypothetical protein